MTNRWRDDGDCGGCSSHAGEEPALDVAAGLLRVSFLVQGIYAQTAGRHGLTPAQARLLCMLIDRPRGMAELARLTGVEKAGLTGLVDRVERQGLAVRAPVLGDRRTVRPTLTSRGRSVAAALQRDVTEALEQVVAGLPPADRESFRSTLARIVTTHAVPPIFTPLARPPGP